MRTWGDEFSMISAKEILGLFPECEVAPSPLSSKAELSVTLPLLLFGSLAAS
jgi:hypothetical protein